QHRLPGTAQADRRPRPFSCPALEPVAGSAAVRLPGNPIFRPRSRQLPARRLVTGDRGAALARQPATRRQRRIRATLTHRADGGCAPGQMEGRIGEGTARTVPAISTAMYTRRHTVAISATMPAI